jgi:hypothetical protein
MQCPRSNGGGDLFLRAAVIAEWLVFAIEDKITIARQRLEHSTNHRCERDRMREAVFSPLADKLYGFCFDLVAGQLSDFVATSPR